VLKVNAPIGLSIAGPLRGFSFSGGSLPDGGLDGSFTDWSVLS
jgi:hypothetical protein